MNQNNLKENTIGKFSTYIIRVKVYNSIERVTYSAVSRGSGRGFAEGFIGGVVVRVIKAVVLYKQKSLLQHDRC